MRMKTCDTNDCNISAALKIALRSPGWSGRNPAIRRLDLDSCVLFIVPARRWVRCHIQTALTPSSVGSSFRPLKSMSEQK